MTVTDAQRKYPKADSYSCPHCDRVFRLPGNYGRHLVTHAPDWIESRFWPKVHMTSGCWLWTGGLDSNGYGHMLVHGRKWEEAHRIAYENIVGPIPAGLTLDHLCHNADPDCIIGSDCQHRRCVRPDHLEPCEGPVNQRRALETRTRVHHCRLCPFTTRNWPAFQSHMRHKHPELYVRKAVQRPSAGEGDE